MLLMQVRVMYNSHSQVLSKATPSTPVEVLGWRELPSAGDEVTEVQSEVLIAYKAAIPEYVMNSSHLFLRYKSQSSK